jgi:hypothetical protein
LEANVQKPDALVDLLRTDLNGILSLDEQVEEAKDDELKCTGFNHNPRLANASRDGTISHDVQVDNSANSAHGKGGTPTEANQCGDITA